MAVIKAKDFEDLLKRVNPFGIRDEKGIAMTFDDYGKCYFFVLCFLYEKYQKGFIDVPLFLHELMGKTLNDARRIAKKLPFITTENEIFLCAWIDKESHPKRQAGNASACAAHTEVTQNSLPTITIGLGTNFANTIR